MDDFRLPLFLETPICSSKLDSFSDPRIAGKKKKKILWNHRFSMRISDKCPWNTKQMSILPKIVGASIVQDGSETSVCQQLASIYLHQVLIYSKKKKLCTNQSCLIHQFHKFLQFASWVQNPPKSWDIQLTQIPKKSSNCETPWAPQIKNLASANHPHPVAHLLII